MGKSQAEIEAERKAAHYRKNPPSGMPGYSPATERIAKNLSPSGKYGETESSTIKRVGDSTKAQVSENTGFIEGLLKKTGYLSDAQKYGSAYADSTVNANYLKNLKKGKK